MKSMGKKGRNRPDDIENDIEDFSKRPTKSHQSDSDDSDRKVRNTIVVHSETDIGDFGKK